MRVGNPGNPAPKLKLSCRIVQPASTPLLSNEMPQLPQLHPRPCLRRLRFICYKLPGLLPLLISPLRHFDRQRHRTWCALVVLAAVCSLTVSVATRYSSPDTPSSSTMKTVHTHTAPDVKRQRLAKNAANWLPLLVCFDGLRVPSSYPRIARAGRPAPSPLFEQNLYNRPPPLSEFHS